MAGPRHLPSSTSPQVRCEATPISEAHEQCDDHNPEDAYMRCYLFSEPIGSQSLELFQLASEELRGDREVFRFLEVGHIEGQVAPLVHHLSRTQ